MMLSVTGVSKSFGGVRAVEDVSLTVPEGRITALVIRFIWVVVGSVLLLIYSLFLALGILCYFVISCCSIKYD